MSAWVRWPSALNLAAGIWLVAAPFALGFSTRAAIANDVVVGVLVIMMSAWALFTFRGIPSWINAILGVWLIVAPYALEYHGRGEVRDATSNDIAVGVVILVLSVTATFIKGGSPQNWRRSEGDENSPSNWPPVP